MNELTISTTVEGKEKLLALEQYLSNLPQTPIDTSHTFHAGVYARTITIPAGVTLTGVTITIPTLLIITGHCAVTLGDEAVTIEGYEVIPAAANRKSAYHAVTDTHVTMIFQSDAVSIEAAEDQFTDEADRLMSRHPFIQSQELNT
jgi:hypothetical protein